MSLPPPIAAWFAQRGWHPRRHQLEMVAAARDGSHALLVAPTGAGKTLAGFLATLADLAENPRDGLHTIYVSPLKALAVDVQRNLLTPVTEIGLDIRIETRTGDTPSDRKRRQRERPPHILLTTPESLALLISYPDAAAMLAGVKTVIVDEIHAFATTKRGDQLSLALSRLQALAPDMRRVGLSATIADPEAYQGWLAPDADSAAVRLVTGDPGAEPVVEILVIEDRIPWAGHNGRWAARAVMRRLEASRLAIVFVNTRAVAELVFRDLWAENDQALPIGIHHGSLSAEARRKTENAMASGRLRAIVATASLDLGIDWGDVDLVVQMGAPKGSSRLLQRTGRANHRMDEASRAIVVPGNRFEYLEALAAQDAVREGELDEDRFRPGGLDVLAQHIVACAAAAPFQADALFAEIRGAAPYAGLARARFDEVIAFVATGGYSLSAYDRYQRLKQGKDGSWRLTHPRLAAQHRLNAGTIVEAVTMNVVFGKNGRSGRRFGQVEEWFGGQLRIGDSFMFAGQTLEVTGFEGPDIFVRHGRGDPRVPTYVGGRMPLSTNLAARVRGLFNAPERWAEMPPDVREWLEIQQRRSLLPGLDDLLVETFERDGRWFMVAYGFAGRNAHQTLGMLLTQRMEAAGLQPLGFVGSDYVVAVWSLQQVTDPRPLFSPDVFEEELAEWMAASPFLRRAFREVAIIGGLIERTLPGQHKTGKAMSVSSDLIYDVLRRHEPGHLLLTAAWHDARSKLTDIDRLAALLETAQRNLVLVALDRVSPLAVPVLLEVGRERVAGTADTALLLEASALAAEAMQIDGA
ncbi:ligase-associated DNA damage response DEXH box helicase [Polymorphobacter fuscus]|uniref:Ligase-associated DNA damage response DEXH box helicase n=1 Tax=Sandarakinorhabdus fusca TaxID=1439888 RepID=A0A7C9GWG6_9SPHN|nr:ligase-associated DNA damage response DEXH box helicase [Polymorphobacter fuscus]KAB7644931.1 ligase-associated DNA damage response DEXH box helicase [Polymorphobacter fuscus]MQT18218.1 ligase-associated DNA damage response DEXH box helicase [Polymorphobacter fuscus]NJC09540.1 ATP-dependent Lhr-like helicase [Polymorphobacter fuscus]